MKAEDRELRHVVVQARGRIWAGFERPFANDNGLDILLASARYTTAIDLGVAASVGPEPGTAVSPALVTARIQRYEERVASSEAAKERWVCIEPGSCMPPS